MSDHLGNPKLTRTIAKIMKAELTVIERLFYLLLSFKLDRKAAQPLIKEFVSKSRSGACDYVIYVFLRCYCAENEMPAKDLSSVLELLKGIRDKYVKPSSSLPPFVRDTFATDMKRAVILKHRKTS
jgi:hypothetical protein